MFPINPLDRADELRNGAMVIVDDRYYDNEDIEALFNTIRDDFTYIVRKQVGKTIEASLANMPMTMRVKMLLQLDDILCHDRESIESEPIAMITRRLLRLALPDNEHYRLLNS